MKTTLNFIIGLIFFSALFSECKNQDAGNTDGQITAPAIGSDRSFKEGDTVCIIGDSITHARRWHRYINDYYVTRFPNRRVIIVNCGISGDSAKGVLLRLERDIMSNKPTAAVFLLGMNDVERWHYNPELKVDDSLMAKREHALLIYKDSMMVLSELLRDKGVKRLTYCTPTPFDETAVTAKSNLKGVNNALARCAEIDKEAAREFDGEVIDLHGPMTELNLKIQRDKPAGSVVGWDRIHPDEQGQMVMAYLFLKAQQVPSIVSSVKVDFKDKILRESSNSEVSNLDFSGDAIAFTLIENSLPWPIQKECLGALSLVPIEKDLDQEILEISALPSGKYSVEIDKTTVGTFTSEELGQGINLALNPETPQYKQAQGVLSLMEQYRLLGTRMRTIAGTEHWALRDSGLDFNDYPAVKAYLQAKLVKLLNDPVTAPNTKKDQYDPYFENKPRAAEIRAEMSQLLDKIYIVNKPVPHRYRIYREALPGKN